MAVERIDKEVVFSREPGCDESVEMTGVILAGGKSRRMGRPKLFIDVGGIPMFERVYRVCDALFTEIIIVANDSEPFRRYDASVIPDIVPGKPIRPNRKRNIMMGTILGLVLGIVFSFLWEYIDRSVRTEEDIEKHIGLPVLSVIPEAGKGKGSDYRAY